LLDSPVLDAFSDSPLLVAVSPEELSPDAALEEAVLEVLVRVVVVPDAEPLEELLPVPADLVALATSVLDAVLALRALAVSAGSWPEASWT
jgi:hypothetical protein